MRADVEPVTLELIDAAIGEAIERGAAVALIHDYVDMRNVHVMASV